MYKRQILTKTVKNNKTYTVYALMDENRNYKDFQLLPEKDTIINNIYAARVNKILPGINAAFVTIAQNKRDVYKRQTIQSMRAR